VSASSLAAGCWGVGAVGITDHSWSVRGRLKAPRPRKERGCLLLTLVLYPARFLLLPSHTRTHEILSCSRGPRARTHFSAQLSAVSCKGYACFPRPIDFLSTEGTNQQLLCTNRKLVNPKTICRRWMFVVHALSLHTPWSAAQQAPGGHHRGSSDLQAD